MRFGDQPGNGNAQVICDLNDRVQLRTAPALPFRHIGLAHTKRKAYRAGTGLFLLAGFCKVVVKQFVNPFLV